MTDKTFAASHATLSSMQYAVDMLEERGYRNLTGKEWGEIGVYLNPTGGTFQGIRENMALLHGEAIDYLSEQVARQELEFADNFRIGVEDDPKSMFFYFMVESTGCCGYYEEKVTLNGVTYIIGCNYGH